jgi:hypothetical protein
MQVGWNSRLIPSPSGLGSRLAAGPPGLASMAIFQCHFFSTCHKHDGADGGAPRDEKFKYVPPSAVARRMEKFVSVRSNRHLVLMEEPPELCPDSVFHQVARDVARTGVDILGNTPG